MSDEVPRPPHRVRVTSSRRDASRRRDLRPLTDDLDEQSTLGEVYMSGLMAAQLRLALARRECSHAELVAGPAHQRTAEEARRSGHDDELLPERAVLEVVQVVTELQDGLLGGPRVAAVNLRPAGHARLREVTQSIRRDELLERLDVLRLLRARPDEAHVARQNVPELWQLIEMRAT